MQPQYKLWQIRHEIFHNMFCKYVNLWCPDRLFDRSNCCLLLWMDTFDICKCMIKVLIFKMNTALSCIICVIKYMMGSVLEYSKPNYVHDVYDFYLKAQSWHSVWGSFIDWLTTLSINTDLVSNIIIFSLLVYVW